MTDEVQRSFDAMKLASALREAVRRMVSAIHLAVLGADSRAHAADYLARTEAVLRAMPKGTEIWTPRPDPKAEQMGPASICSWDE